MVETMIEARVIKCGPGNTQPGFDPRARCSTAFGVQGSWTVRTGGMLGGLGTRDPPPPPHSVRTGCLPMVQDVSVGTERGVSVVQKNWKRAAGRE